MNVDEIKERKTVVQRQPLNLNSTEDTQNRMRRTRKPKMKRGVDRVARLEEAMTTQPTQDSTMLVLDPIACYAAEKLPACPFVVESRSLYRWRTKMVVPFNSLTDSGKTAYFRVEPSLRGHVQVADAVDTFGRPTHLVSFDDPSYGVTNGNLEYYRMTGCAFRVRNVTAVSNIAGFASYGVVAKSSALVNVSDLATLQSSYRHGYVPGDIETAAWRGSLDNAVDYQFVTTTSFSQDLSTVLVWASEAPSAQSYFLEVYSFWEGMPYPTSQSIYQPTLRVINLTLQDALMAAAYASVPPWCTERNVRKDDGMWDTFKSDINAVFGAVDKGYSFVKKTWGALSSVGDAVAGAFGSIFGDYQRAHSLVLEMRRLQTYNRIKALFEECKTIDEFTLALDRELEKQVKLEKMEKLKQSGTIALVAECLRADPSLTAALTREEPTEGWLHLQQSRSRSVR